MNLQNKPKLFRFLAGYYGILQIVHLFLLGRAGIIIIRTGRVPFPAQSPPGGWNFTTLPFLLGMGAADVFAASLGIYFVSQLFIKKQIKSVTGIISLTVALTSGLIFLIGTIPSGAWNQHFIAYLAMVIGFSPLLPLYLFILKNTE